MPVLVTCFLCQGVYLPSYLGVATATCTFKCLARNRAQMSLHEFPRAIVFFELPGAGVVALTYDVN